MPRHYWLLHNNIDSRSLYLFALSPPDKIDPALLRPGRLEKHVYIGYAHTDDEWNDLCTRIASSRALDPAIIDYISSGRLLQEKGNNLSHLRRLSAADLKAVMDTAHLSAVHEHLRRTEERTQLAGSDADAVGSGFPRIEMEHVLEALQSCRPSLGDDDRRMLGSIYAPFYCAEGDQNGGGDPTGIVPAPPLGDYYGLHTDTNKSHNMSELNRVPMQRTTLR